MRWAANAAQQLVKNVDHCRFFKTQSTPGLQHSHFNAAITAALTPRDQHLNPANGSYDALQEGGCDYHSAAEKGFGHPEPNQAYCQHNTQD
jgi:hypothetical protein